MLRKQKHLLAAGEAVPEGKELGNTFIYTHRQEKRGLAGC